MKINKGSDCLGFSTMWNDIAAWEKSRSWHKRKRGVNKKGSNCYNFGYPSTSPSPDHAPLTLLNPPKSWDSSAIYHVQFGGELTEIWWMRRRNGHNHVYLHEFFTLFLETQTYESPALLRALWIFFYIFLSPVGGLSPTMTWTWHFETTFPCQLISEKPMKCKTYCSTQDDGNDMLWLSN